MLDNALNEPLILIKHASYRGSRLYLLQILNLLPNTPNGNRAAYWLRYPEVKDDVAL